MERKTPFVAGQFYHVYTRGVDKRIVCAESADYNRLQLLLYLCNSTDPINLRKLQSDYKGEPFAKFFEHPKDDTLVDVVVYALMPNHLHLLLHEKVKGGISKFMLKLMTAYSMYFNTKHQRSGPLFTRPFRSRHIDTDEYLRWIFSYIHSNPIELHQHDWKIRGIQDMQQAQEFMRQYPFSSFVDHHIGHRPESSVLNAQLLSDMGIQVGTFDELLHELSKPHPAKGSPL